ncbi:hypothetical protein WDZ92_39560 [Nostoc sp. NIES-2111]
MDAATNIRRLLVTQEEACQVLGIKSKTTLRLLEKRGLIEARWAGKLKLITWASLETYASGLPRERPTAIGENISQLNAAREDAAA